MLQPDGGEATKAEEIEAHSSESGQGAVPENGHSARLSRTETELEFPDCAARWCLPYQLERRPLKRQTRATCGCMAAGKSP